jgi:DNA-binding FrmR family transcriptional regulator
MADKEDVIARLRRIEGQVRGLARMVEQEAPCEDVLTQLLAARAALDQAALCIISRAMEHCLPDQPTKEQLQQARHNLQRIMELLLRLQ